MPDKAVRTRSGQVEFEDEIDGGKRAASRWERSRQNRLFGITTEPNGTKAKQTHGVDKVARLMTLTDGDKDGDSDSNQ